MNILVLSSDSLVQTALAHLLEREDGCRVFSESLPLSQRIGDDHDAAVVIIDTGNDERSRADLVSALSVHFPTIPVIALVAAGCVNATSQMFALGARGVVARDASAAEFVAAVREVCAGHVYASRSVTAVMADLITALHQDDRPERSVLGQELLSEREHAVVDLLTKGMTNSEIARSLHLAEATVKAHLSHVMTKWSVRDRTQVVLRALGVTIAGSRVA